MQRICRPNVDFGQSIWFSALYSLQALEQKVGDSKLQCRLDQWLIDGGMGVCCVHCLLIEEQWLLTATCSVQPGRVPREHSVHET